MRLGQDALAHGDMRKLLWSFCLPSLAANLVTSVYNIVDQIFIGNVLGIVGNAATNVVFPVVTLITALSLMCGVGSSAVMNLLLGRGEAEKARRSVACGFGLMVLCGALVSIAMLGWTSAPFLPFLNTPTLVLGGDKDRIVPLVNSKMIAKLLPNAKLHVVKGGGHLFIVSRLAEILPLMREFLAEPLAQPKSYRAPRPSPA